MAVFTKLSMLVDVYKNTNTDSKYYGHYYPRIFYRNGLNLKGFAKHISEHGSLVKYDLAVLVLQNIVTCLREMMVQGIPVKLDGLGTFRPGIQAVSGGGTTVEDVAKNLSDKIEGVRINFLPESAGDADDKLDKKTLKEETTFEGNDYVVVKYKMIDGKKKSYQERHPLKTYGIEQATPDPEPEP